MFNPDAIQLWEESTESPEMKEFLGKVSRAVLL